MEYQANHHTLYNNSLNFEETVKGAASRLTANWHLIRESEQSPPGQNDVAKAFVVCGNGQDTSVKGCLSCRENKWLLDTKYRINYLVHHGGNGKLPDLMQSCKFTVPVPFDILRYF